MASAPEHPAHAFLEHIWNRHNGVEEVIRSIPIRFTNQLKYLEAHPFTDLAANPFDRYRPLPF